MFIFLFITISYTKVTDLIIEKSQKLKKKKLFYGNSWDLNHQSFALSNSKNEILTWRYNHSVSK